MRKVVSSNFEVCHLWANQTQEEARAKSGNLSFHGTDIYSYNWLMARLFPRRKIVLIRDWEASVSTSCHLWEVRRALPSYIKVIKVHNPADPFENNVKSSVRFINEKAEQTIRARGNTQWYYQNYLEQIANLEAYCKFCRRAVPKYTKLDEGKIKEKVTKIEERSRWREEERKKLVSALEQEAERRNARMEPVEKQIEEWRRTGRWSSKVWKVDTRRKPKLIEVYSSCGPVNYPCLRINDREEIETTYHARITVEEGKTLWEKLKRAEKILGHRLSGFPIVGYNGDLVIGCHHIPKKEMRDFLLFYGWATLEEVDMVIPLLKE